MERDSGLLIILASKFYKHVLSFVYLLLRRLLLNLDLVVESTSVQTF